MTDLQRMKDQREYEAGNDAEPGVRKGRLWYRNCRTGCSVYDGYEAGVYTAPVLANACSECPLLPGPGVHARHVEMVWTLPDATLNMVNRPYWFVSAVSFLRLINHAPGF